MTADPALDDATRLVARTWLLLLGLTAVAATVGLLAVGPAGAVSAATGAGLVTVLFGVSTLVLRHAVARDRGVALGLFAGGLGARLAVYLVVLETLSGTVWLHRPSLAIATATSVVISQVAELVWLHRSPHLFIVDPEARHPLATSTATRS